MVEGTEIAPKFVSQQLRDGRGTGCSTTRERATGNCQSLRPVYLEEVDLVAFDEHDAADRQRRRPQASKRAVQASAPTDGAPHIRKRLQAAIRQMAGPLPRPFVPGDGSANVAQRTHHLPDERRRCRLAGGSGGGTRRAPLAPRSPTAGGTCGDLRVVRRSLARRTRTQTLHGEGVHPHAEVAGVGLR